ncbi:and NB-ARC domain-containing protein [Rutstroemia sp. NJR-2017a WRK4]|nr:and NB-ARC domain-containing protein [Rutstroemia sp. NJR-2017a WRK4]
MKKLYKKLSRLSSRNPTTQLDNVTTFPPTVPASDPPALGLKILHDNEDAEIDIIALHGQNGHPVNSWMDKESGVLWLRDLLPEELGGVSKVGHEQAGKMWEGTVDEEIKGVKQRDRSNEESKPGKAGAESKRLKFRVLSYGYGAKEGAKEIAAGLMRDVDSAKGSEAISSLPPASPLLTATQAILFFGVAQNMGFESLNMIETFSDDVLSPEMRSMRKEGMWLREGEEEFERLEKRKLWTVIWFREIADGGGKVQMKIQDDDRIEDGTRDEIRKEQEDSESRVIRLGKTHGAMVRFADREDEDFRNVVECLKKIVRGG